MAKSRKVDVVDGYTALKAAQHAVRSPPTKLPAEPASELQKLGAHVGRTVIPAKHVIECYECGYKFQLHGKAASTNCSKCRAILDLTDHVIAGKWREPLKTAGAIRLTKKAVLEAGELIANDIILGGTVEAGTARAMRTLELRPGARFPQANLTALNLSIAAGAVIELAQPAEYHDVEISGILTAKLKATGLVTIHAGGLFAGRLESAHLAVEDGGGLDADVGIETSRASRG